MEPPEVELISSPVNKSYREYQRMPYTSPHHLLFTLAGGVNRIRPVRGTRCARMVICPSEICDMLKERRNLYPDDIYVVRQQHHDKPVAPNNFSRYFRSVCDKAGIKDQGLHRLRHTFTSMSYAAGIDSHITQNQLGHSSLRMTVGVYTHINPDLMQDASEQLYQQLSAVTNKPKKD